eukprot:Awhi_evm1s62
MKTLDESEKNFEKINNGQDDKDKFLYDITDNNNSIREIKSKVPPRPKNTKEKGNPPRKGSRDSSKDNKEDHKHVVDAKFAQQKVTQTNSGERKRVNRLSKLKKKSKINFHGTPADHIRRSNSANDTLLDEASLEVLLSDLKQQQQDNTKVKSEDDDFSVSLIDKRLVLEEYTPELFEDNKYNTSISTGLTTTSLATSTTITSTDVSPVVTMAMASTTTTKGLNAKDEIVNKSFGQLSSNSLESTSKRGWKSLGNIMELTRSRFDSERVPSAPSKLLNHSEQMTEVKKNGPVFGNEDVSNMKSTITLDNFVYDETEYLKDDMDVVVSDLFKREALSATNSIHIIVSDEEDISHPKPAYGIHYRTPKATKTPKTTQKLKTNMNHSDVGNKQQQNASDAEQSTETKDQIDKGFHHHDSSSNSETNEVQDIKDCKLDTNVNQHHSKPNSRRTSQELLESHLVPSSLTSPSIVDSALSAPPQQHVADEEISIHPPVAQLQIPVSDCIAVVQPQEGQSSWQESQNSYSSNSSSIGP